LGGNRVGLLVGEDVVEEVRADESKWPREMTIHGGSGAEDEYPVSRKHMGSKKWMWWRCVIITFLCEERIRRREGDIQIND
jgi:hypothetical protein